MLLVFSIVPEANFQVMIHTYSCPIRIANRLHFAVFWKSGHTVCQKPVTVDPCNRLEFTIALWAKIWCVCLDSCVEMVQQKELAVNRGRIISPSCEIL